MNNTGLNKIQIKTHEIKSIKLIEYHIVVRFRKKREIIRFKSNPLAHNLQ